MLSQYIETSCAVVLGGQCRAKFERPAARLDDRLFAMEPGVTVQ